MAKPQRVGLQLLLHILALLPLAVLIWEFSQGRLTANPIEQVQRWTGRYTMVLLALTLSCTPVNTVFGFSQALRLRRYLGLYTFFYASLHFLNFIGLDYGFDFSLIRDDLAKKYFIFFGFTAWLCLLLLALISPPGWRRRPGLKWERLGWSIYLAAALVAVHFLLAVKADIRPPLVYSAIVALLLLLRLPVVSRAIIKFRRRLSKKPGRAAAG